VRKLLVSSFVSLDGVVEAPMTWASRFFDDECREYALRKLDDVEYFLLGRKAYEALVPAWTTVTGNAYIDRINGLKKARGVDDARRGQVECVAHQGRGGQRARHAEESGRRSHPEIRHLAVGQNAVG